MCGDILFEMKDSCWFVKPISIEAREVGFPALSRLKSGCLQQKKIPKDFGMKTLPSAVGKSSINLSESLGRKV